MTGPAMRPAIVVWGDAHEEEGVFKVAEFDHKPVITHCCGWVVIDDKEGMTLCQEWWDREDFAGRARHLTFIPRGMIQKVTYLDKKK